MDYLLRDSYFTGAKYGEYNIEHLIKNICIGWRINSSNIKNFWVGIAINEKGKGAFEDFVHSRFQMYLQVYNHKSVMNFKWLIRQAVQEVAEDIENKDTIRNIIKDRTKVIGFTDTFFWEMFRKHAQKKDDSACSFIINRQRLRHLKSLRIDKMPKFEVEDLSSTVAQEFDCENIIQTEAPSKFSKINSTYEKTRLLSYDKKKNRPLLKSISSDYFENSKDIIVIHYFENPFLH